MPVESKNERFIKRPIRALFYPLYLICINKILDKKYKSLNTFLVDQWYWGTRGLEYRSLRKILNKKFPIKNKTILIAGCGTGKDVLSWAEYMPKKIIGVDYFNYKRAWNKIESMTECDIEWQQANLSSLQKIDNQSIDIIGSDAVFEHINNLDEVLREFNRVLKKGGVLYATFGPLWNTWGGDHISGYDGLGQGFNHLLMSKDNYQKYVDMKGSYQHSEDDGRTWMENDLFSYLKPEEYIDMLNKNGFNCIYVGAILEPKTFKFLEKIKDSDRLIEKFSLQEIAIAGLSVIFQK